MCSWRYCSVSTCRLRQGEMVQVRISDTFPVSVLLGMEVPELFQRKKKGMMKEAMAVKTRARMEKARKVI